jgi:glucose/mannose transport system substrate-binding protein
MSPRGRAALVGGMLLVSLAGCSAPPPGSGADPNDPDQVEVVSWLTTGSEKRGYDALLAEFATQNPGLEFFDSSVTGGGGDAARNAIDSRLDNSNPPDSFQATAGAGLADYVDDGRLLDLTSFYTEHHLDGGFRDTVLDLLQVDGAIYSVPLDIHRVNIVWSNSGLLMAAGLDPAHERTTLPYWMDDLQTLRDSGVEYPLALGEGWTQVQLFETVLLAEFGPVGYKDLWKNAAGWDADTLAVAVDEYGSLLDFVDPASRGEHADAAVHRVVNGNAAYVVMIDTAASAFEQAAGSGHEYGSFPVPGTAGVFDFSVDAFTLPVGAAHPAAAKSWLLAVASAEGQRAFSLDAGSIPARSDTEPADYPAYQQTAIASSQDDTVAPSLAHGVAARPAWVAAILDAVVRFRDDRHPVALVNALRSAAKTFV